MDSCCERRLHTWTRAWSWGGKDWEDDPRCIGQHWLVLWSEPGMSGIDGVLQAASSAEAKAEKTSLGRKVHVRTRNYLNRSDRCQRILAFV